MIQLKNISKTYSKKNALTNVNLSINKSQVIGLVGENGAGKSTLMKIIAGLIKSYAGEKKIDKKIKIGYLIDSPSFYKDYDAKTNLKFLSIYNDNITNQDIEKVYNIFKLDQFENKKFSQYSLGMKQRLGIAYAMLGNPDLLILDEPFNGIDPKMTLTIINIIKDWVKQTNSSVIISSHILSQLDKLCTKVVFIDKGSITSIRDLDESNNDNFVYVINLVDSDKKLYDLLLKNHINIIESVDMKYYKISLDKDSLSIINIITKNFSINEIFKERENLENIFRKMEGM